MYNTLRLDTAAYFFVENFLEENLQKPFSNPAKRGIILLHLGDRRGAYASFRSTLIHNDLKGNDKNE